MTGFLSGNKTLITGVLMILMAGAELAGFDLPGIDADNAMQIILEGSGLIFLRLGIKKIGA